ncbi:MAG: AAA family ATPase [Bacteroidaceae bacterium]|nr:AAA family ATPase [Bacteroidaceae bacterium]
MKHLIIRNFGPLKDVDIDLGRMNLIIGLQGSGKSCVMITACYCTWVEKRISLRQSAKEFEQGTAFLDTMTAYYRIKGYVHDDTYISYETEFMSFSYDNSTKSFSHKWKNLRWRYKRPKVSYVPAERNMVSLVTNWNRLETNYDNILDFKEDWDTARRYVKSEKDILGTGISYEYDEASGADAIITKGGKRLDLTNSSSGMQSLIPQYVHMDYLTRGIYEAEKDTKEKTYAEKQLVGSLLEVLYRRNRKKDIGAESEKTVIHLEGKDYVFQDKKVAEQFRKEALNLVNTDHAEIFLEEPESNLFPPTQFQLMDWIVEMASSKVLKNTFFIATHSPYVLNHLLQENIKEFRLMLTHPMGNGLYGVMTADEETLQQIYDNGSDAFFNFEPFTTDETV